MFSVLLLVAILASPYIADSSKLHSKDFDGVVTDEEHFSDDEGHEHSSQYDHDAFLGKDEASTYNDLTPEESKAKLADIFPKVDADSDGLVTEDELQKWMVFAQNRYAKSDAQDNLKQYDPNGDGSVAWDEYKQHAYGFLKEDGEIKDAFDPDEYPKYIKDENSKEFYAKQLTRDERKFKTADVNADSVLNVDELAGFLHPETQDHMKGVTALENLEDMDKDKDGTISIDEYLADIMPEDTKGEEPEWLKDEKKNFTEVHDKNKDGKLDADEVKQWIFPAEEDYLKQEAKHLIEEADANKDGDRKSVV